LLSGFSLIEGIVGLAIMGFIALIAQDVFKPVNKAAQKDKMIKAMQSLENMMLTALEDNANYANLQIRISNGQKIDFFLGGAPFATFDPNDSSVVTKYDKDLSICTSGKDCVIDLQMMIDTTTNQALYRVSPNVNYTGDPVRAIGATFDTAANRLTASSVDRVITDAGTGSTVEEKEVTGGYFEIPADYFSTSGVSECDKNLGELALKGLVSGNTGMGKLCWKEPLQYRFNYTVSSTGTSGSTTSACPPGQFPTGIRLGQEGSSENPDRFYYVCRTYRTASCAQEFNALSSLVERELDSRVAVGSTPEALCVPLFADTITYTPTTPTNTPVTTIYCPYEDQTPDSQLGLRYTLDPFTPTDDRTPSSTTRTCTLDKTGLALDANGTRPATLSTSSEFIITGTTPIGGP